MSDDGTDTPDTYVLVHKTTNNICSGPSHGDPDALPKGNRRWFAGQCLSLTQGSEEGSTHNIFCGPGCLCDWHGVFDAALQSAPEGHDPPGRFTLVWIAPTCTTIDVYDDWAELTEHVGNYQRELIEKGII